MGRPLDNRGEVAAARRLPLEREAPAVMDRAPVSVPLQTGIKVIDSLIAIGRGQRELILGDRQTGKTAIILDTIINQHDKNVICIYCAIGKQSADTARVVSVLESFRALPYCIIVVAAGEDPPGLQYIPLRGDFVGEYFMKRGKDVLVILTT
jgi:F-type H+-transporting ATPase subunit alpha